jgi:RAB6-interacting golgin
MKTFSDFMEAQKRYDRAEKEFISAKMNMFASLERKELLTDHLCTIIEQVYCTVH